MHDGKARIIVGGGEWIAGAYVQIHLRPAEAEDVSQHAYQAVLHVGKLRWLKRALSIDYDQGVQEICAGVEVVRASVNRIPEALRCSARTRAQQCVSH